MPKLPVVEIFTSIQGEGLFIGKKSFFLRLAGCNLRCSYCDTSYAWDNPQFKLLTSKEILKKINRTSYNHIVITGGEPLLHDIENLCMLLQHQNYHITIETNGTLLPSQFDMVDLWSVSPKLSSAGQYFKKEIFTAFIENVPKKMQLKFVILDKKDFYEMLSLLEKYNVPSLLPIIIQPNGLAKKYTSALKKLTELFLESATDKFNIRILPQLHRIIWKHQKGI